MRGVGRPLRLKSCDPLTAPMSADGTAHGRVRQLNVKAETPGQRGLPKAPVPEARLGPHGTSGDFNRFRHEEKHDDPRMAILILPIETIAALDREGWPVRPGDLGENITSEGLPYEAFAPGAHVRVGEAELEVTKPCDPCDILNTLPYVGTARGPEFVRTTLGRRGWYARVVREGTVRPGDPIDVTPPAS